MRICPKCKTLSGDGIAFCPACGTPTQVYGAGAVAEPVKPKRTSVQPPKAFTDAMMPVIVEPPKQSNLGVHTLKNAASSKLFLAVVILFTVSMLFSVINLTVMSNVNYRAGEQSALDVFDRATSSMQEYGVPDSVIDEYYNFFDDNFFAFFIVSQVFVAVGLIPQILMLIALWLVFAAANSKKNAGMKTSGLTMVQVLSILRLILVSFVALISEMIMVAAICLVSSDDAALMMKNSAYALVLSILIFATVVITVVFVLAIVYYALILSSIAKVKRTGRTGVLEKVSGYVAVMLILFGTLGFLSALGGGNAVFAFSSITRSIAFILLGSGMFSYRAKVKRLQTAPLAADIPVFVPETVTTEKPDETAPKE